MTAVLRRLGEHWPFAVLGAVYILVAYHAWQATRREARTQHDIAAFDLCVEYGITALAVVLVAVLGLIDPTIIATPAVEGHAVMATGTVLVFAALGVGRFYFVWSRLRAQRQEHPFQRRSIAEAAAELGQDDD